MKKLVVVDIRFEDEKLNRLVQALRATTQEVVRLQTLLEAGTEGQVLTKTSQRDYEAAWQDP